MQLTEGIIDPFCYLQKNENLFIKTDLPMNSMNFSQLLGGSAKCLGLVIFMSTSSFFSTQSSGQSMDLFCNSGVNIVLDADCQAEVSPDQILEGDNYGNYENYYVVFDGGISDGESVLLDASDVGESYDVRVELREADGEVLNSCSGSIMVMDGVDPTIECPCQPSATEGISGTIGTDGPQFALPIVSFSGSCILTPDANHYYEVITFTVDADDSYTFTATVPDADTYGLLYLGALDPENPCDNFVAGDDDLIPFFADDPQIIANLTNGNTYSLVLSSFQGDVEIGDYSWSFSSAGGGQIFAGEPDVTDCTFACTDLESILGKTLPGPSVIAADNCEAPTVTYEDIITTDGGNCGITIVTRTYTATDASGNTATCTTDLFFEPSALENVVFPENIDLVCGETENDLLSDGTLKTGEPTGAGCNISFTKSDNLEEICDGSYQVLRTWTAENECLSAPDNVRTASQVIKILDNDAPMLTCPENITVSTTTDACVGNTILQVPDFTDCGGGVIFTPSANEGTLTFDDDTELWTLTGLPLGVTTVTWVATDDCGNADECSYEVIVEDDIAPIPACELHTIVALGEDGLAEVEAMVFDDGSTDNCGIISYQVRKMTPPNDLCELPANSTFSDKVTFCCADIGTIVMVEFKVEDEAGNSNICMVEVEVQDKIDPILTCPSDKIVECVEDILTDNFGVLGEGTATDNCSTTEVTYEQFGTTDCGVGTITRRWKAEDIYGNIAECDQIITIINSDPFFINDMNPFDFNDDVVWPIDYTTNACGADLEPTDLPTPYNQPTVFEGSCSNIAVTHEDFTLEFAGDEACLKILRKWIIIDWCQVNNQELNGPNPDPTDPLTIGVWHYVQIIKIMNSTDPEILEFNGAVEIDNIDPECGTTFVAFDILASDDCTNAANLKSTWEFSDGQSGDGTSASGLFSNGFYTISFTVDDQCGNSYTESKDFEVKDAKAPTPVCFFGISSVLMPSSGSLTLSPTHFEIGSSYDNCTDFDDLNFSFSEDPLDQTIIITCEDIPPSGSVPVTIVIMDLAGNMDSCATFVQIDDPFGICPSPTINISGYIENENEEVVQDVTVILSDDNGMSSPIVTGSDGFYQFEGMNSNNYELTPEKDLNYLNGVTTYDLLLINKHILGTEIFDSPYKWIAADANRSNTITTLDIVLFRAVILHIQDGFTNNTSWRFVDKNYEFVNTTNPLMDDFPERKDVGDSNSAANFVGVKIGDVNETAQPNNLIGTDTRDFVGKLAFQLEKFEVEAQEVFTLDFRVKDFNRVLGYQFSLNFDQSKVDFVSVSTNLDGLTDEHFGWTKLEEGVITTSWNKENNLKVAQDEILFSMTFMAKKPISTTDFLTINSRYTPAEAYINGDLYDLTLAFDGVETSEHLELYQNTPNPFESETTIGFHLPKAENVSLKIYDVKGQLLRSILLEAVEGFNAIKIEKTELQETGGVFYYQLKTESKTLTKKMILIN